MQTSISIENGWLPGLSRRPSDNYNDRPEGVVVDLLVIHNISLPPGHFTADDDGSDYISELFCNTLDISAHPAFAELAGLRVSAHFLVSRQGRVTQYVPLDKRAWHAGVSRWEGRENCNDFSVGIELEGTDTEPYTDAQYRALTQLTRLLMSYYPGMCLERIVGHCDIAPDRKTDPGPAFDWEIFRAALKGSPISR